MQFWDSASGIDPIASFRQQVFRGVSTVAGNCRELELLEGIGGTHLGVAAGVQVDLCNKDP